MFTRILVPVDLSERGRPAIDAAAELTSASGGTVVLLHVIETIRDVPYEELEDFYASLRDRAEGVLDKWADQLGERGVAVERQIVFGRRGPEIVRCAEAQRCDLIVLTSHRVDPERPGEGFGTLSHQVALLASAPVLLMR